MKCEKTSDLLLEKSLKKLLEKGVYEGIFPAGAAGISYGLGREKKNFIIYYGNASVYPEKRGLERNNFFDLASLTKPLATTLATLCLIKEKKTDLDEKIKDVFEKKVKGKKGDIRIRNLLSHSSGLPAHRKYYEILKDKKNSVVENLILQESLEYDPGMATIYSDLGFILLGKIIEKKTGIILSRYVEEKILSPLTLQKEIFYNPLIDGKSKKREADFVATESCPWRKKTLCGEVHDDNCYSMGGVAGHSGLFGNIEGVTKLAGNILDIWKGTGEHPNIEKEDLRYFLTRQEKIKGSTWALGFDTPSANESSSGIYLSKESVGHLGFTGTSFWIDPQKNLVIVLLTNRVHPSRNNSKIKQFRPYFHNRIVEILF